MALLIGGSFIASVVSDKVYDPIYDTGVDAAFIYQVLPSFYRTLMQDQEVFSTVWSASMQSTAADLLNLWQIDYAKSLRDVPVLGQRKWVLFDLFVEEDFSQDPGLVVSGLAGVFTYDDTEQNLAGSPTGRARWDKAGVALRGGVDERTSLAWSVGLRVISAETCSAVLFGYYAASTGQLSNALTVALLGSESNPDEPVAAILHFDPNGIVTVSIDSYPLSMDTDYRFDATYTAGTGAVVLSVIELRAEKLTGTVAYTGPEIDAVFTNQFHDDTVNFDTAGIVAGDRLIVFGTEYSILSVDGSLLVVSPVGLPVEVTGVPYAILGEVEVTSLSMDLPGDAPDPTFTAEQFGVSGLDTRSVSIQVFSDPAAARRKTLVFTTDNWRYLEPTVEEVILSLPRLQDVVTAPTLLLYEGTDYVVETSTLRFQEPPLQPLWAEYVAYDESYIYDNFGANVGLEDVSSDLYKARVRGLYYAYFQGPTVAAVRLGVHILVGLPIADKAGIVEAVNPVWSGTLGLITVAGRDYLYPNIVGTSLSVGDDVALFEPLSNGVEVVDYRIDPEWFVYTTLSELQKYHTFQVRLDIDAFDPSSIALAGDFVDRIKPTWKSVEYLVFKNLSDTVDIDDHIDLRPVLNLVDNIGDPFVVAYDDDVFEPPEQDWMYDQGIGLGWSSTSSSMRTHSALLVGYATLTNGSVSAAGSSTSWLLDLVAGDVVMAGVYSAGVAGETTAGSNDFVDVTPNVFDNVVVGDHIDIAGEGTFEVLYIAGDTLTLDAPLGFTNTGVSWEIQGRALTWAEVFVVNADDDLDFSVVFPGTTGTYAFFKLDPRYRYVYYDEYEEASPDESFQIILQYTNWGGGGPYPAEQVPAAPFQTTTTFNFLNPGDTYTVTLDERVP
jgi:hypothetical protein